MNISVLSKSFLVLLAASLIFYGLSGSTIYGLSIVSVSLWKLVALSLGISILFAFLYPYIRGVRKGDQELAVFRREAAHGNFIQAFLDSQTVTALENGRKGQKIRVRLLNNKRAEGIITSYAGTFSPATIKLTETEV